MKPKQLNSTAPTPHQSVTAGSLSIQVNLAEGAVPASTMEELIAYADEQGDPKPNVHRDTEFAVGVVVGGTPVSDEVIQRALSSRREIPGHDCISREYFHAKADCKKCRQLLADTIREHFTDRIFVSLRWPFSSAPAGSHTEGDLHRLALTLALGILAANVGARRATLYFEKTKGMSVEAMTKWLDGDVNVFLNVAIQNNGQLPIAFVPFSVVRGEKEEAGLQVADHILWREHRELGGESGHMAATGFELVQSITDLGPINLRYYTSSAMGLPRGRTRPLGRHPRDLDRARVIELLLMMEANVHAVARQPLDRLRHLERIYLSSLNRTCGKENVGPDDLLSILRTFLVLLDTIPLYDSNKEEELQTASDAARVACFLLRKEDVCWAGICNDWQARRRMLVAQGHPMFV